MEDYNDLLEMDENDPEVQYKIAMCLISGIGVEKNLQGAIAILTELTDAGYRPAIDALEKLNKKSGIIYKKDYRSMTLDELYDAHERGDTDASKYLAYEYKNRNEYKKAFILYDYCLDNSELTDGNICLDMANLLLNNKIPQDTILEFNDKKRIKIPKQVVDAKTKLPCSIEAYSAAEWLLSNAAEKNIIYAFFLLYNMALWVSNSKNAILYLEKYAANGSSEECNFAANVFGCGNSVIKKDDVKAQIWYERSVKCANGLACHIAEYKLGKISIVDLSRIDYSNYFDPQNVPSLYYCYSLFRGLEDYLAYRKIIAEYLIKSPTEYGRSVFIEEHYDNNEKQLVISAYDSSLRYTAYARLLLAETLDNHDSVNLYSSVYLSYPQVCYDFACILMRYNYPSKDIAAILNYGMSNNKGSNYEKCFWLWDFLSETQPNSFSKIRAEGEDKKETSKRIKQSIDNLAVINTEAKNYLKKKKQQKHRNRRKGFFKRAFSTVLITLFVCLILEQYGVKNISYLTDKINLDNISNMDVQTAFERGNIFTDENGIFVKGTELPETIIDEIVKGSKFNGFYVHYLLGDNINNDSIKYKNDNVSGLKTVHLFKLKGKYDSTYNILTICQNCKLYYTIGNSTKQTVDCIKYNLYLMPVYKNCSFDYDEVSYYFVDKTSESPDLLVLSQWLSNDYHIIEEYVLPQPKEYDLQDGFFSTGNYLQGTTDISGFMKNLMVYNIKNPKIKLLRKNGFFKSKNPSVGRNVLYFGNGKITIDNKGICFKDNVLIMEILNSNDNSFNCTVIVTDYQITNGRLIGDCHFSYDIIDYDNPPFESENIQKIY